MSQAARLTSIDLLPTLSASIQKFRSEAGAALDDLGIEMRRASEWIHHDRKDYWEQELRRAYERLNQAQLQLQQAKTARRVGDREPACIDEQRAVQRARRRVDVAQQKIAAVRAWTNKIDRAMDDFRRARTVFSTWLETDMAKAAATLNKMSERLTTYVSMESPTQSAKPVLEAGEAAIEARNATESSDAPADAASAPEGGNAS
jgi:hypothetical protein